MNVLVTGGTSLLGGAVAGRLAAAGHRVATMQRHAGPAEFETFIGDITDREAVKRAMADQDVVVHLAARVGVTGTPAQFARTNVDGTRTVLTEARRAGVRRFVHISSPSVAHAGFSLVGAPAGPADPVSARGHYAATKARAEVMALEANAADFVVVAIRPHLVWGPGDTQLVGRIVNRARSGDLAFVGSGLALIDTTYIDNAADAIVAAVDHAPEAGGRALVVSNGQPRTVWELVRRIVIAAGLTPPVRRVPYRMAWLAGSLAERIWERQGRADDPPMTSFLAEQLATAHWFDQRETRRILQWTPAVSLEEGFDRLAGWFERIRE